MNFILFQPIFQERVWGGRKLQSWLGRALPKGRLIGESWEIVDRPEAQSIITSGPWMGKTLRGAIESYGLDLLGPDYVVERPFPILVKWLDCQQRLSLQVHPPAALASELGGEPKTENWYVADATPGAILLVGLKRGVTREQFEVALRENTLEPLIHTVPTVPGDSMFVPSGSIHAIDAGNLILEIQQNSDTTYRVFDWGRVGLDGKPRPLHLEESLRSINFDDYEPPILSCSEGEYTLVDCSEFRLRKFTLQAGVGNLEFAVGEQPRLLHVVSGSLRETLAGGTLRGGNNVLLPYCSAFSFQATKNTVALVTDNFT